MSWYTIALLIICIVAGPEAYIGMELFSLMELLGASTFALAYLLMFKMFFERVADEIKKVVMLLIIIAALPFAFELLLFVEIAGIETAYACLMIMIAPLTQLVFSTAEYVKCFLTKLYSRVQNHPVFRPNIYVSHVLAGSFVIILTGSLFLSTMVWLPVLMFGELVA